MSDKSWYQNFPLFAKVNGYQRRKDRVPFDATEMMKKIQECFPQPSRDAQTLNIAQLLFGHEQRHYKPPGKEIDVEAWFGTSNICDSFSQGAMSTVLS